ncbi:YmfQ family protein [Bacillus pumilus]|uniref:YmfQ family protein n=1 Tax=Bacillus pumilus TaxID=1408 RepID=UPI002281089E|nr:YmfQ family protein [Bacillus pumilus]MCY7539808.1 YmfQ family protein [Bacillus pumilus]MEC3593318.1 YmfQ family protein [Bacillus pumilus]
MSKQDEMKNYLPPYFTEIYEVDHLLKTEAPEFEQLDESIFDLTDQFFPLTATWGLNRWERMLKVQRESDDSIELRRARLLNMMSNIPPITYLSLEKSVNRFLKNPSAIIRLTNNRYHFALRVNLDDLQNTRYIVEILETLKPAHLAYTFTAFHHTDVHEKNDHHGRLTLRSRVGFFDHIPILLNGEFVLNGTFYLSGTRGTTDVPARFRHSLKMRMPLQHKSETTYRMNYVMTGSVHETRQKAALTLRTKNQLSHQTKKKMTFRLPVHVQTEQGGSLLIKDHYWILDGSVPLDGSKMLAATSQKIEL